MTKGDDFRVAAFERALRLDDLSSESEAERSVREDIDVRLAPLASLLDDVEPSADLFARITGNIAGNHPLAGIHVARGTDGTWQEFWDGIAIKTLWHSTKSGRHVFLIRIQPGAILPEHRHSGDEECMVIEGDLVVNGVTFGPGDFQVAFASTVHPVITSRGGCTCLISVQLRAA